MVAFAASAWCAGDARAEPNDATRVGAPAAEESPAPGLVRVALSKSAAAFLTEGRVRRLIDLELPRSAPLAPEPVGPLDENAVRVFIDLPEPGIVTIQAQAPLRKVEVRKLGIAGLAWDVAARVTAIATSESVRALLAPVRKRPTRPREPTQAELDAALRRTSSFSVSGAAVASFAPSLHAGLGGAKLSVLFHHPWLSEELALTAQGGDSRLGQLRYLEASVGASHRVWLGSSARLRFGGVAALANLRASRPDVAPGAPLRPEASFTVRAAGLVGLAGRVAPKTWLSLDLEPGALLIDAPVGARGAWLGASLGLSFEEPLPSLDKRD